MNFEILAIIDLLKYKYGNGARRSSIMQKSPRNSFGSNFWEGENKEVQILSIFHRYSSKSRSSPQALKFLINTITTTL